VHFDDIAAGLLLELRRGAVGDRPAVADDDDVVGEVVGLFEILRGQQDVGAVGDEHPDRVPELELAHRIQSRGRLVQKKQSRRPDQAGAKVELAPHASRVGTRRAVGVIGQPELVEDPLGVDSRRGSALPEQLGDHLDVLSPGHGP
jgi:hypothetical protein